MNKIILLAILLPLAALAVREPITVKSYAVEIDERSGISTYTGAVKITQGFLLVKADKIQIFSKDKKLTKMVATGSKDKPAYYQQNQDEQFHLIKATAQSITYFIDQQRMHLVGAVNLTQRVDFFSGDSVDYDIKNDKVVINKSADGSQRVKFKIKL
ncbi:MAG: lipopolysaccharide transport periplasmic protein LptA [Candidatus Thioglobus sp.]|nr:MAG: lipopolysaccharide transport periplasmic protein LptA [Candidatus Thioglobus sp.]